MILEVHITYIMYITSVLIFQTEWLSDNNGTYISNLRQSIDVSCQHWIECKQKFVILSCECKFPWNSDHHAAGFLNPFYFRAPSLDALWRLTKERSPTRYNFEIHHKTSGFMCRHLIVLYAGCNFPGPPQYPILGNLPQIVKAHPFGYRAYQKLAFEYGDIMYVRVGSQDQSKLA